jgi:hypothetical protein
MNEPSAQEGFSCGVVGFFVDRDLGANRVTLKKHSRNCSALLKITVESPQLLPAKSYSENAEPDRLVIGFDD